MSSSLISTLCTNFRVLSLAVASSTSSSLRLHHTAAAAHRRIVSNVSTATATAPARRACTSSLLSIPSRPLVRQSCRSPLVSSSASSSSSLRHRRAAANTFAAASLHTTRSSHGLEEFFLNQQTGKLNNGIMPNIASD